MKRKKRLRIFAGPNGSGKSTLFYNFPPQIKMGIYVNADEIEKTLRDTGELAFDSYKLQVNQKSLERFLAGHPFQKNLRGTREFVVSGNTLKVNPLAVTSYLSAIIADFIRKKLIQEGHSLSFETVMSSPDKVEFIRYAKKKGYKTYLYFIATEHPDINIDRIHYRVNADLGHFVLNQKVIERYYRSLELLYEATKLCYRGYLFDNTGTTYRLCAEKTPKLLKTCGHESMPVWLYQYVLLKNFDAEKPLPLRKL